MSSAEQLAQRRREDVRRSLARVDELLIASGEPALGPTEAAGAHKSLTDGCSIEAVVHVYRSWRKFEADHAAKRKAARS